MNSNFDRTLSNEDVMRRRASLLQRLHIDGILLLLLLILGATGLFVLYSASGKSWDMLMKQATSFGLGLGMMVVIAQIEPRFMARWVPLGYLVGVALLVVVDVIGHDARGDALDQHPRGDPLPALGVHEAADADDGGLVPVKRNLPPGLKHMVISLAIIITPFVLILKQPDLGTAMLILASGGFVLFVGGLRWRWIVGAVSAAVPIAVAMWFFIMHDYQKQRVLTFLDLKATRWAPAGTSSSLRRPSVPAGYSARAGCWAPSRTWIFCRKATPTLSLRSSARSSAWSASACCWCSTCC